jgi:hypothetical protein
MVRKGKSSERIIRKAGMSVLLISMAIVLTALAFVPVTAAQDVEIRVSVPEYVEEKETFDVTIDIDSVTELTWSEFDLIFDKSVVKVEDVTEGSIDDTEIPIVMWDHVDSDIIKVMTGVPEDKFLEGVSGSGYLAMISFKVKGDEGDESVLELSNGVLGNTSAGEIPASWVDAEIKIGVEEKEEEEGEEGEEEGPSPTPSPTPTDVANVTGVTNVTNVTETPTPTPTPSPTLAPGVTPSPTPTLALEETPLPTTTPAIKPKPKPTPTPAATLTPTPTPKPAVPGFEAVLAIATMSAIAYILLRKQGGKEE